MNPKISPVQVVDGVAPVVLVVPTEAGETHAHVAPRNLQHTDTPAFSGLSQFIANRARAFRLQIFAGKSLRGLIIFAG